VRRRLRSNLLSFGSGGVGFVAAASGIAAIIMWRSSSGWTHSLGGTFLAFSIFVAVAELLEVPLERGAVFSLALAPGLAFAVLRLNGSAAPIGEVAAVFIVGLALAQAVRAIARRPNRLPVAAARLLVVLGATASYHSVIAAQPRSPSLGDAHVSALGLFAVLVVVGVLDVALQSLLALHDGDRPYLRMFADQARATGPLLLSSVSVAALLALSYPALRAWTLPLFLAPLAATQFSFRQVATIRRNYLQTVGALAKVPEMAGYTQAGHSRRVADLALALGKELGVGDPELHEIEYAALLHDIGRISLPDPEEASKSTTDLQLALVGASIIEETGHFPNVAVMVRDQHEQYRRRGEETNPALSLGAKIIKVASAYDDLTVPPGPGRTPAEAMERLYVGMAYDYDPRVIQAMSRVLEREGSL